ncbi:MAG: carboxypeptidase-like regulatory domain-containing protein, partial [Aigarchaeota archaeon]|nr:carboxypeptidase-like regulatory domain-containing protein [Candidatus Pelearchaeum maunauluense]
MDVSLYVLKVWVKDAQGNYVPNAVVKVWRNTEPADNVAPFAETTTSSQGLAEFTLMPEGTYYVQIIYRDVVVYTASTGIVIPGDDEVTIETSLQTYTITVYDSDGSTVLQGEKYPLSGQLYIGGSTPFGTPATTTNGELNFGLVFPGEYRLVIKLGNIVVFNGTITAPTDTSVNAGFYDLIINIDPEGVFDERLLSEIEVNIQMGDIFSVDGVTTQRALRIENLPKGTYDYILKYGTKEIGTGEFTLNEDEQRVILKADMWTLTLNILNADGEAIKASITISTVDGLKLKTLDTNDEGVLELTGLIPITYEITIFYENVKVGFEQIALNGDTDLDIITDVFNIRIRVLDADGEKAIPAAAVIVSRDEISREGITDEQGIALLKNLPIGKYRLEILYYDNPVYRQDEITFDSSKQIDIKAKGIIDVTFNILDAAGEPLDDGYVEIFSGQARFSENITKGQVRFSSIPSASYRLSVKYLGVEVLDQLIPLSIEEDVRNINTNVYYLSVEVRKADDTPLSSKVSFLYRGKEIRVGETNENGKLVVRLPKGEYSVQAYFKGTVVAAESIVLRSDAELLLNAAVYKVSIQFVDISEKPIPGVSINLVRDGDIVESAFTNQDGVAEFYIAGGKYEWMFTVDNHTFTSNFAVEDNKEFIIPYVVNNVNNQVMVFASVAGVSAISVFSLFKFSKPTQRRERGERRQEER